MDRCPHKGGPLSQGIVHGRAVTCPLHDWMIDLATGEAHGRRRRQGLRTIPVKVEGGRFIAGRIAAGRAGVMEHARAPAQVRPPAPIAASAAGVGATSSDGEAVTVRGDPAHPANFGRLCSKGAALGETVGLEGRLLHPMIGGARGELGRGARPRRAPVQARPSPSTGRTRWPSTSPASC